MSSTKRSFLLAASALALSTALPSAQAQAPAKRLDPDELTRKTGAHFIVFEAADGFQLLHQEPLLKRNIRLDVDAPSFVADYLRDRPLSPEIDLPKALEISRTLVRQAIQHRTEGRYAHSYLLYRFILANVLQSDDLVGADIVTSNTWVLRAYLRNNQQPARPTGGAARAGDVVMLPSSAPLSNKAVVDLMAADGPALHDLIANTPRYAQPALEQDTTLRRVRVLRRVAEFAGRPGMLTPFAERLLTRAATAAPVQWLIPLAEELAGRDLLSVLASEGRIKESDGGFRSVWSAYNHLRPRLPETDKPQELASILDAARLNYAAMRASAVSAGGTFGHQLSFFTISQYLQTVGRDLVGLYWRGGAAQRALALAEEMQSRAVTDWLARAHPSDRLMVRPGAAGSVGEIRPAKLDEIKEVARKGNAPILYYFKSAEAYYLWIVLPDGRIAQAPVRLDQDAFAKAMRSFPTGVPGGIRGALSADEPDAAPDAKHAQLLALRQQVLPDELLKSLRPFKRLLIVPDGILNFVPFAALVDEGDRYLIDSFTISTSPSVTTLLVLQASTTVRRVMGKPGDRPVRIIPTQEGHRDIGIMRDGKPRTIAFDPLPGAEQETNLVARLTGGSIDPKIGTNPRGYLSIMHFATHGFFDADAPLDSFLILRDGTLKARDLYLGQARIPAGLVVMSACQTGLGFTHPDSVIGLQNGLLVAGAEAVVSTLWLISDAATLAFMETFYQGLTAKKPVSEALRDAQLALRGSKDYADPYFWGAFQLMGLEQNPL